MNIKAILVGVALLGAAADAAATVSVEFSTMSYQGRLKESGAAVTGNRDVRIYICNAFTGGLCFSDTPAQSVAVADGVFKTTFTLPGGVDLATGNWFLEAAVGPVGGGLTTLTPREKLTSSPFSIASAISRWADKVDPSGILPGNLGTGVAINAGSLVTGTLGTGVVVPAVTVGPGALGTGVTLAPEKIIGGVLGSGVSITYLGTLGTGVVVPAASVAAGTLGTGVVLVPGALGTGVLASGVSVPPGQITAGVLGTGVVHNMSASQLVAGALGSGVTLSPGQITSGVLGSGVSITLLPTIIGIGTAAPSGLLHLHAGTGGVHMRTSQVTPPSAGTPGNCGLGPSSSMGAGATDMAGELLIIVGGGSPSLCDTVVTFNQAYGSTPKALLLTPASAGAAEAKAYISGLTTTNFTVTLSSTIPSAASLLKYVVIE